MHIENISDRSYSFASLVSKVSSMVTCKRDNKIIFFPSGEYPYNFFDVFDLSTKTWSIGVINDFLRGGVCFMYNNDIYYAGGYFGSPTFGPIVVNDKILRLEF